MKWLLPVVFAVLGFTFSTKWFLTELNKLNPIWGLLFYYGLYAVLLMVIGFIGLNTQFGGVRSTLGYLCVFFAFAIVTDFSSGYISEVLNNQDPPTNIYLNSEDGATYYLFHSLLGLGEQTSRMLTYVLTPLALSSIGVVLM
jgi:hypothetical protein